MKTPLSFAAAPAPGASPLPLTILPSCTSTNAYCKEHAAALPDFCAVCTDNQTAGRGRLGRAWVNAAGQALYYTVFVRGAMVQPETLPQLSSLVVQRVLQARCGGALSFAVKWPNDLLVNGKKVVGILCESVDCGAAGRGYLSGIGINVAQPQAYFDAAGLPYGTSLLLQGAPLVPARDIPALAAALTAEFRRVLPAFAREGFAPSRAEYCAACINLGRTVRFDLPGGGTGTGTAVDVDEGGRLQVRTAAGELRVFTGEVLVHGIYGNV